jgi:hypothetical protein
MKGLYRDSTASAITKYGTTGIFSIKRGVINKEIHSLQSYSIWLSCRVKKQGEREREQPLCHFTPDPNSSTNIAPL